MENNKNQEKNKEVKKPVEKPTTLYEDMNGHKHDSDSYDKLMREQTNKRKNSDSKPNQ